MYFYGILLAAHQGSWDQPSPLAPFVCLSPPQSEDMGGVRLPSADGDCCWKSPIALLQSVSFSLYSVSLIFFSKFSSKDCDSYFIYSVQYENLVKLALSEDRD